MKRSFPIPFIFSFFTIVFFSCVKNTDFNQADEIVLTPVYELDLIYFNLDASDFYDSIVQIPRLTVIDTTQIRFLDDSFVREDLKKAEFQFDFTNSIPRSFQVDFQFLNAASDTTYTTQTTVVEGTLTNPIGTTFIETVGQEDIMSLTEADRVVVRVTIPDANDTLQGALNLQSKTTYFLEIQD